MLSPNYGKMWLLNKQNDTNVVRPYLEECREYSEQKINKTDVDITNTATAEESL